MNGPTFLTDRSRRGPASPEIPTEYDLQTGDVPPGTYHRFIANDRGLIGDDVNTFPTTGTYEFVPHRAIIRSPHVGVTRNGIPTMDETAYIPAFSVGDPR